MAFGFSKTKLSPIAIDFGADSVKLLQMVPSDPPQLVAAGAVSVPEHARSDPASRRGFVEEALRSLLRTQPFRGKQAVLSFPAFQSLMQHIEISRVEDHEMEAQVGLTLRTRLNVDPNRMVMRHFPVRQLSRNGAALQEVICLAAARDVVMGYIEIAQRCKLDVVGMHSEPIAVLKAFEHLYRTEADQKRVTCYIDIGAATTKVVVAHGTRLVLAKSIHAAGDQMTRLLARERGVSFADAAKSRRDGEACVLASAGVAGVATGGGPRGMGIGHADTGATGTLDATAETVGCIIDELRLALRYHGQVFPEKPIEKLVFLGGESRHTRLCQQIAQAVRLPAQLGDPMARVAKIGQARQAEGVNLDQPQPAWAVPVGLCLCEASA